MIIFTRQTRIYYSLILLIGIILFSFSAAIGSAYYIDSSDTLQYSNSTLTIYPNTNGEWWLGKTVVINQSYMGSYNTSVKYNSSDPCCTPSVRIYKNGLPIGAIHYIYPSYGLTMANDTLFNLTVGDEIQVYYRIAGASVYLQDFGIYYTILDANLTTPVNGSYDYFDFPDFFHNVYFSWYHPYNTEFNIKIAKDIGFNLLTVDKTISANYTTESLEPAAYYWKVRTYDSTSGTYGEYSNVSSFNLIRNSSTGTGTRIEGMIYTINDGIPITLSGATVYIRNEALNWSDNQITGSNGYYLFSNLTNNTVYSIYAKNVGYEDSMIEYVTTIPGQALQKNIILSKCISGFNCFYNQQYVTFTVRNLFDVEFPGVTVTVYKGDELIAYDTGLTDSGGSITFLLTKDQKYRVTFAGGGIEGTITYNVFGSQTNYRIVVVSGFPDGGDRTGIISTNLSSSTINATHSNLSLAYNDSISSTTSISLYATNLTTGDPCYSNSTSQAVTLNCTVPSTGTYRFGFTAISSVYGTIRQDKVINFGTGTSAGNPLFGKVDPTLLHWASIMLLVFVAAMFSIRTVKFGAVLVPAMALVLWSLQWLQVSFLLIATAMCLGTLVYLRMSEHKVEY